MSALHYRVKVALHKNTALYAFVYNLLTFNRDYARQKINHKKYSSKFGGMWTDSKDFEKRLAGKKFLSSAEISALKEWRDNGIYVIPSAVHTKGIDDYLDTIERLAKTESSPLLMSAAQLNEPIPYDVDKQKELGEARLVDDFFHSQESRNILFSEKIMNFLELVFEKPAILTQSLRFNYGSEQPIHQDTAFVRMNAPMKLVGVWIALEDIKPGSGELLYLPGSHKWEGFLFSGRFKHYDETRDGPGQLAAWHQWILDEAKRRGVKPKSFAAKKGDVLFWHAGLAHGGAPIENPENTRLSLVGHYCPIGVRPLYHYYKPSQRKVYRDGKNLYTTSYYKK